MVIGKLLEYAEDIKRFCVNNKWAKFYRDYKDGDEDLATFDYYYKNSYDDYKGAANDLCYEIIEYFDLLWNELSDKELLLEDEKQNPKVWLDDVCKKLKVKVAGMSEGPDLFGFLIKGCQMLLWIRDAAIKTDEQFYGKKVNPTPYYIGESKEQLFNNIYKRSKLHESYDKAGFALTKLKGYLRHATRWEYDGDGEPYLVDNENEPPLYTVQWTEKESGSQQGYYSVEVEEGDEWDSTIYNFSDVRSTYQKIEDTINSKVQEPT